jgi:hypothetical protein
VTGGADSGRKDAVRDFHDAVNMTASELEEWLATDESRRVGQHKGAGRAPPSLPDPPPPRSGSGKE